MLGVHATYPSSLKVVKLHRQQVVAVVVVLLLTLAAGGWWAYQNGWLSQWLPLGNPPTVASGQIVIKQAQPAGIAVEETQSGQAVPAAGVGVTAAAVVPVAAETAAVGTAAEPVAITGVAGVNGVSIWDNAGNLLATLDSGAPVTVKASAGNGSWLWVDTAAGEGWTPADSVIAYGLGRLTTILLPSVVAAANAPDTANMSAAGAEAGGSVATVADTQPVNVAIVALRAEVMGGGSRLNIRSGPGTEYTVLAQAEDGAVYTVVGRNAAGDWLLLQIGDDAGSNGWAAATFLALSSDLQTLPVVDAATLTMQGTTSISS